MSIDLDYKETRKGPGYHWSYSSKTSFGTRHDSGYTVDNLDTKGFLDAESLFEKVFILTRESLLKNASRCMDSEVDRLQCCHDIARSVSKSLSQEFSK